MRDLSFVRSVCSGFAVVAKPPLASFKSQGVTCWQTRFAVLAETDMDRQKPPLSVSGLRAVFLVAAVVVIFFLAALVMLTD